MPKKLILEFDLSEDFYLFGISTSLPDYRLAWYLNKFLQIQLVKQLDFTHKFSNDSESNSFPFFIDESDETKQFYLIQTKIDKIVLFPNQKKIDFLFLVKDAEGILDTEVIINHMLEVFQISSMYVMESKSIKNIMNFLSEMELHILDINKSKNR